MTGTEVERIEHHGVGALEQFVVGRVLEASRHPDADRLSVCIVDTGDGEPSQIVCGAPNVAAGQTVAVAKPGAVMPDGTKLRVAKLRGQESNGMILAEDEVAIGTEHDGIMVLDDDGLVARHAARTACCRSRPTCSSSRSPPTAPTAWRSTASPARSTQRPGAELASPPWAGSGQRRRRGGRADHGRVP